MANATTVNLNNGVPNGPAGSATVSTIDQLIAVGSPIKDGISSNVATVAQFHNADNQALAGTAYGLLAGGVAQIVNASGNLDRQRGTSTDAATGIGLATGAQQLAWPATCGPVTSGAITGNASPQTITLTAVSGTTGGVAWALQVGQSLVLEPNTATQEAFVITALNVGAKTVTGIIKNNHSITAVATAFFFDQARSAIQGDGASLQGIALEMPALYNGATADRQRGNVDTAALITLAAQAAGTVNSADQTNYNGRGVQVVFDMTVATTTSVVINIQGKDAASGKYYTLLSSAAIVTAVTTVLTLYPGAPLTANVSSPQVLPRTWRVQAVVTGGSSAATATVGASVIV